MEQSVEKDEPVIFRLGSLALEEIEHVIGTVDVKNKKENAPNAPGMLKKHYAPRTKTILVDDLEKALQDYKDISIGILKFTGNIGANNIKYAEILSNSGDLNEATSNLYGALHRLDASNVDLIIAERFPNHGLGKSINDRLERAST